MSCITCLLFEQPCNLVVEGRVVSQARSDLEDNSTNLKEHGKSEVLGFSLYIENKKLAYIKNSEIKSM